MTSRQHGKSVLQSIMDAKEVSTNFNRKGSGAMGNIIARSTFIFLNSSIQGLMKNLLLMHKYPKTAIPLFSAHAALGILVPLWAMLYGGWDDDDEERRNDYWDLTPWERRNKLCIRVGDNEYAKWSLPHFARAWYGVGEILFSAMSGHMDKENVPLAILAQLSAILPIDPVNTQDIISPEGTVVGGLVKNVGRATLAGSVLDAYVFNEDFLGRPISHEHPYNTLAAEYTKANDHTLDFLVEASKWSNNKLSGGNAHEKGWADWNPSKVQYVFENFLGGTAQFASKITKIIEAAIDDEKDVEWDRVPFARKFYSSTDSNYAKMQRANALWKWYKTEYKRTTENLKNLRDDDNADVFIKSGRYDAMIQNGELSRHEIMKEFSPDVNETYNLAFDYKGTNDKAADALFNLAGAMILSAVDQLLKTEGEKIDWIDVDAEVKKAREEWQAIKEEMDKAKSEEPEQ